MSSSPTGTPATPGPRASAGPAAASVPVGVAAEATAGSETVTGEVVETREPAELVRDAVLALPGVARLHAGAFGTVATYLPGRRVSGVSLREDGSAEVSVVAHAQRGLGTDLRALAARVSAATAALVPGPVHVTVADLTTEDDAQPPPDRPDTP